MVYCSPFALALPVESRLLILEFFLSFVTTADEDIVVFLKSRYGIVVTAEEVRDTILQGMQADAETEKHGGGEDEAVLDIMELMSILLIPLLSKSAKLAHGQKFPKGVDKPPEDLIQKVLQQILPDVLGPEYDENNPPALTPGLLKRIFKAYGEDDIAENKGLLKRMIESCELDEDIDAERGGSRIRLDERTFAQGLTHDVGPLDIINETRKTTGKDDVFLSYFVPKNRQAETIIGVNLDDTDIRRKQAEAKDVETDFTFASIDLAASTYRSKPLMVFLYATVLITYFAYFNGLVRGESGNCDYVYSDTPWLDNAGAVACDIAKSVGVWLFFFFFLCFFGVSFVVCASIGNDTYCDDYRWPALGLLTVVLLTMVPFLVSMDDENTGVQVYLRYISFVLGLIVCTLHLIHIGSLTISERWQRYPWIRQILNPSALYSEYSLKKASAHKLNKMAQNAIDLLERGSDNKEFVISSNFGRALFLFSKHGSRLEPAGGIRWTWREARNKVLYSQEGIWYSARILASNICQYIVSLYLIIGGFSLSTHVSENYREDDLKELASEFIDFVFESQINNNSSLSLANNVSAVVGDWAGTAFTVDSLDCSQTETGPSVLDSYCDTNVDDGTLNCQAEGEIDENLLCGFAGADTDRELTLAEQLFLLEGTGFNETALQFTTQQSLQVAASDAVAELYPQEQYMISVPLVIGVLIAFLVALNLAVSFLPSVTSTILQLRSGVILVKGSPFLQQYRAAPESVAILIGSLFWGTLFSAILTGTYCNCICTGNQNCGRRVLLFCLLKAASFDAHTHIPCVFPVQEALGAWSCFSFCGKEVLILRSAPWRSLLALWLSSWFGSLCSSSSAPSIFKAFTGSVLPQQTLPHLLWSGVVLLSVADSSLSAW